MLVKYTIHNGLILTSFYVYLAVLTSMDSNRILHKLFISTASGFISYISQQLIKICIYMYIYISQNTYIVIRCMQIIFLMLYRYAAYLETRDLIFIWALKPQRPINVVFQEFPPPPILMIHLAKLHIIHILLGLSYCHFHRNSPPKFWKIFFSPNRFRVHCRKPHFFTACSI